MRIAVVALGKTGLPLAVQFADDETWEPDYGWMDQATELLANHLTLGTLVSCETTLPVRTTRNRWKSMIEQISGLTEGQDFHLIFSPENWTGTPRLIIGQ